MTTGDVHLALPQQSYGSRCIDGAATAQHAPAAHSPDAHRSEAVYNIAGSWSRLNRRKRHTRARIWRSLLHETAPEAAPAHCNGFSRPQDGYYTVCMLQQCQ